MTIVPSFINRRAYFKSLMLAVLVAPLFLATVCSSYAQLSSPNVNHLVPGSAAYRTHAHLSMINHMAPLLYPGSFRHYSNAYRATYNEEYDSSDTVLPPYTSSQVRWMLREMRPVRGMSIGHYCDRLGSIIGCVDRLRLTVKQQHAICVEVAGFLPSLPTGTDHPLPVCISEMFADLHYWQALPEVKALLPKYSRKHDAYYSWDTSEARLRSAISKLEAAEKKNTTVLPTHAHSTSARAQS